MGAGLRQCAPFPLTLTLSLKERGQPRMPLAVRVRSALTQRGVRRSLSPRERAGVRGNGASKKQTAPAFQKRLRLLRPLFRFRTLATVEHPQPHLELARQFDAARVKHPGAPRGEFNHPVVRHRAQVPRAASGKPNFQGIWQAQTRAAYDLQDHAARPMVGQPGFLPGTTVSAAPVLALGSMGWMPGGPGVVEGGEIPYQPWAAKRKAENQANWIDRDPELKCFQPGIPRAMYMPFPFEIIQSSTKVEMVFEFANAQRTIHLNKMEEYPNIG